MKKTVVLAGLFLLPLLASAYELEPQYAEFAKELNGVMEVTVQTTAKKAIANDTNNLVKKVKKIIKNARKGTCYYGACGTGGGGSAGQSNVYYDATEIENKIASEGLKETLKNNEDALTKVAQYITENSPHLNDFEALLAVGVKPIEAAIRAEKQEYIQEALEESKISYAHYIPVTETYYGGGHVHYNVVTRVVSVSTDANEIATIKTKIKQENSTDTGTSFWRWLSESFNGMGRGYGHW